MEAEHRPLVTYSSGPDGAWAAKVAGDYWPERAPRRRAPRFVAALASALFIAAFVGAREAAVAALPDLAGLYETVGLPVNLDRFAIDDLSAERLAAAGEGGVRVRGTIRAEFGGRVPPLALTLSDGAGAERTLAFPPPALSLAAGEAVPFTLLVGEGGSAAVDVAVRFQRRGEVLPLAGRPE
jgi:hypothetical protein